MGTDFVKTPAAAMTGNPTAGTAIGQGRTVYIGFSDENLYALNADGTEKWRFEMNGVKAVPTSRHQFMASFQPARIEVFHGCINLH